MGVTVYVKAVAVRGSRVGLGAGVSSDERQAIEAVVKVATKTATASKRIIFGARCVYFGVAALQLM